MILNWVFCCFFILEGSGYDANDLTPTLAYMRGVSSLTSLHNFGGRSTHLAEHVQNSGRKIPSIIIIITIII